MMQFKEKASILRKQHGMSQLELAEALNVSRQAISKWEQGTAMPSIENLIKIGELYGVSIETLTNDELSVEDTKNVETVQPIEDTAEQSKNTERILKRIFVVLCFALCITAIGVIVLIGIVKDLKEKIPLVDDSKESIIHIKELDEEVIILDEYDVYVTFGP